MVQLIDQRDVADSDIAVVGMRCHFPGANSVDELWQVLRTGAETISRFTTEELLAAGVPAERANHPDYVAAKGVIDGVEFFDHEFFGIDKMVAEVMDPQQRLFLEFAWKALESAGYDSAQYDGRIGVFAGQAFNTYLLNNLRHAKKSHISRFHGVDLLVMTDKDFLATQIAHHLGLTGPAMTVQSACSSSMVAVHQACQALHNRECELALAGGVTIYCPQIKGYFYEPGNLISPDGHIRSFDEDGRGTVYGSGMGLVVLKLLAEAVRDGDTVHAVIKGSAINNDGGRKAVFKAPSEDGIAEVATTALAVSGVDPARIRMVEANGSGTVNGDPIEVHALSRAFQEFTDRVGYAAIGSVKSNLGHLNIAAGIAAILKAILCVKHGQIAPTINFRKPNPAIRFEGSPFTVARELVSWPEEEGPRLASVNSFGVGGTNGHVVIAEAPELASGDPVPGPHLLVLSAETPAAIERIRHKLADYLSADHDLPSPADICYTLQVGRRPMSYRLAVVGDDVSTLRSALLDALVSRPVRAGRQMLPWWFDPDPATGDLAMVLGGGSKSLDALRIELETALTQAGHPRSLDPVLAKPAGEFELAVRTLAGHLAVVAVLAPALGIGAAGGRGVGALSAAVATGALSVGEAVKRCLNSADNVERQTDAGAEDLVVRGIEVSWGAAGPVDTGMEPGDVAGPAGWLRALACLWLNGVAVDWRALYNDTSRQRVPLPTYSFEKVRCWVDIPANPSGHIYDAAI